jgi:IMP dehydrogenase
LARQAVNLISVEEEKALLEKLVSYYEQLFPETQFKRDEVLLSKEEVGGVLYTYQGDEVEATADLKIRRIAEAVNHGYETPAIILYKKSEDKKIILDGHRRLIFAWKFGLPWKAYLIIPAKEHAFGVEKTIQGKISDLFVKPSVMKEE